MIIEDNDDAATSLRDFLESEGHVVHVENSGVRAVELVRSFRPDVVVCDIGLPEKDGFTIASEIRVFGASSPWLIALTGYGMSADRAKAERAGFDKHLVKPVSPESLVSLLDGKHVSPPSGR